MIYQGRSDTPLNSDAAKWRVDGPVVLQTLDLAAPALWGRPLKLELRDTSLFSLRRFLPRDASAGEGSEPVQSLL